MHTLLNKNIILTLKAILTITINGIKTTTAEKLIIITSKKVGVCIY